MSQPTPYTPNADFSQQEANNASGRSTVNTAALDAEFAAIETTLDQTLANIQLLQRDDGKLSDLLVEVHTLSPEVLNLMGGLNLTGLWVEGRDYAVGDISSNGAYTYVCNTAHTSTAIFDDSKWDQFGFTSGADAAQAAANAQVSANAAATSATNASNSAIAADASADSADASEAVCIAKAAEALSSANAAASSETNASNSADEAAISAASISLPIPVSSGGTGATTQANARTNLGISAANTPNTPAGNIAATTVQAALNELDTEKQAVLVSGTNIKTINSNSLLGSGNINVSTEFASSAENIAGTIENKAVDPLGIREAFNATGTAPIYACRAWVNFNGTGTVAIRASGNVSSITDSGVGDYVVNFTTAMPDANYSAVTAGTGGSESIAVNPVQGPSLINQATGSVGINTGSDTLAKADWVRVCVAIFR